MDKSANLRSILRKETKALHERLDREMSPLAMGGDYAAFLRIQFQARLPIEVWLRDSLPQGVLPPPPQTPLIARDLADLGQPVEPGDFHKFSAPPAGYPGVAWAIAGSSLGNRAILQRRRKDSLDTRAAAFLAAPDMTLYWREILPLLEAAWDPAATEAALEGGRAVFGRFLACVCNSKEKIAA